jgi:hypothetical protein
VAHLPDAVNLYAGGINIGPHGRIGFCQLQIDFLNKWKVTEKPLHNASANMLQ